MHDMTYVTNYDRCMARKPTYGPSTMTPATTRRVGPPNQQEHANDTYDPKQVTPTNQNPAVPTPNSNL